MSAILAAWPGVVPGAALAVLAVNVVMLEVAGSVTVAIQRRSRRHVGRAAGRVGIVRG